MLMCWTNAKERPSFKQIVSLLDEQRSIHKLKGNSHLVEYPDASPSGTPMNPYIPESMLSPGAYVDANSTRPRAESVSAGKKTSLVYMDTTEADATFAASLSAVPAERKTSVLTYMVPDMDAIASLTMPDYTAAYDLSSLPTDGAGGYLDFEFNGTNQPIPLIHSLHT